jgi:hypothetical protein
MRWQLPTRTPIPDPAHHDRVIDGILRHRRDQHTQRHLIRTNHHIHARDRATHPRKDQPATPNRTRKPQHNDMINLS